MEGLGRLTSIGTLLVALVAAAIFVGFLVGQPVLLSYVETGSMEPTIETGDGFVVVPAMIAEDPEPGDVVVFQARELGGGRLTTHRIVEETDGGYITRGDANPTTDQETGEPTVTDAQIVGVAVRVGDALVTVPHVGTVIETTRAVLSPLREAITDSSAASIGFPTLLFGIGGLTIVLGVLFEPGKRDRMRQERIRSRPETNMRVIVGTVIVITVIAATMAMVGPAGTVQFSMISTEGPAIDDPLVVQAGGTSTLTHSSGNAGFFPAFVVLEPDDNVRIADRTGIVGPRGSAESSVTLTAPDDAGRYTLSVTEHRYLLVLPPSLLLAFHDVHPLLAVAVVNVVLVAAILVVSAICFGRNRMLLRHRKRSLPLPLLLRRWLL